EFADDERLAARIEHLRLMAVQLQERAAELPPAAQTDRARMRLRHALTLGEKLLVDPRDPPAQDRLASAVDSDARGGEHGEDFVGYVLDMAIDADSELITSINVLPGNGPEAADAITLIQQEEMAQGNDVAAMSMDGAGYNGPVLRELTDPEGLNLDMTVPPPTLAERTTFGPDRFSLKIIDGQHGGVTCPNGQTTRRRHPKPHGTGKRYTSKAVQGDGSTLWGEYV